MRHLSQRRRLRPHVKRVRKAGGVPGLWKNMIPSSCSLPPQVWSDRSRLQCNNAIHSSTVGALRGQLSPRFSKNIPSASAGHFCLQSLHHFATADAATCSAVATVLKGFASLTTRPGVRKMAIPFPLQLSMPTTFPRVVSLCELCGFHCSIRWGGSPKVG